MCLDVFMPWVAQSTVNGTHPVRSQRSPRKCKSKMQPWVHKRGFVQGPRVRSWILKRFKWCQDQWCSTMVRRLPRHTPKERLETSAPVAWPALPDRPCLTGFTGFETGCWWLMAWPGELFRRNSLLRRSRLALVFSLSESGSAWRGCRWRFL